MRRPSIKSSLLLIFTGIAVLFGLVAYLAIDGLGKTNGSTEEIADHWLPSVRHFFVKGHGSLQRLKLVLTLFFSTARVKRSES
jgi:hypothetical protein